MSEKQYGGLSKAACLDQATVFAARDYPVTAAMIRDLLAEVERLEEQQRHAICKECGEPLTPPKRAPLIQRVERPKLRDDIESPILRYILYLEAMLAAIEEQSAEEEREALARYVPIQHGVTCKKEEHIRSGYLHSAEDDSPYDVDGMMYCGRCHVAI